MTKQQFLDTLAYLADSNNGVGAQCYFDKIRNDAYQQEYGERVPSWDCLFLYKIICKPVEHNTPYIHGDWVYRRYTTRETYWISLPAVSRYSNFAADLGSRYTAGDSGVTIESLVTGESRYIAYDDIEAIEGYQMQSDLEPLARTRWGIGYRYYTGWEHVGFLGNTPAVEQMDLSQAVKRPLYGPPDMFR